MRGSSYCIAWTEELLGQGRAVWIEHGGEASPTIMIVIHGGQVAGENNFLKDRMLRQGVIKDVDTRCKNWRCMVSPTAGLGLRPSQDHQHYMLPVLRLGNHKVYLTHIQSITLRGFRAFGGYLQKKIANGAGDLTYSVKFSYD